MSTSSPSDKFLEWWKKASAPQRSGMGSESLLKNVWNLFSEICGESQKMPDVGVSSERRAMLENVLDRLVEHRDGGDWFSAGSEMNFYELRSVIGINGLDAVDAYQSVGEGLDSMFREMCAKGGSLPETKTALHPPSWVQEEPEGGLAAAGVTAEELTEHELSVTDDDDGEEVGLEDIGAALPADRWVQESVGDEDWLADEAGLEGAEGPEYIGLEGVRVRNDGRSTDVSVDVGPGEDLPETAGEEDLEFRQAQQLLDGEDEDGAGVMLREVPGVDTSGPHAALENFYVQVDSATVELLSFTEGAMLLKGAGIFLLNKRNEVVGEALAEIDGMIGVLRKALAEGNQLTKTWRTIELGDAVQFNAACNKYHSARPIYELTFKDIPALMRGPGSGLIAQTLEQLFSAHGWSERDIFAGVQAGARDPRREGEDVEDIDPEAVDDLRTHFDADETHPTQSGPRPAMGRVDDLRRCYDARDILAANLRELRRYVADDNRVYRALAEAEDKIIFRAEHIEEEDSTDDLEEQVEKYRVDHPGPLELSQLPGIVRGMGMDDLGLEGVVTQAYELLEQQGVPAEQFDVIVAEAESKAVQSSKAYKAETSDTTGEEHNMDYDDGAAGPDDMTLSDKERAAEREEVSAAEDASFEQTQAVARDAVRPLIEEDGSTDPGADTDVSEGPMTRSEIKRMIEENRGVTHEKMSRFVFGELHNERIERARKLDELKESRHSWVLDAVLYAGLAGICAGVAVGGNMLWNKIDNLDAATSKEFEKKSKEFETYTASESEKRNALAADIAAVNTAVDDLDNTSRRLDETQTLFSELLVGVETNTGIQLRAMNDYAHGLELARAEDVAGLLLSDPSLKENLRQYFAERMGESDKRAEEQLRAALGLSPDDVINHDAVARALGDNEALRANVLSGVGDRLDARLAQYLSTDAGRQMLDAYMQSPQGRSALSAYLQSAEAGVASASGVTELERRAEALEAYRAQTENERGRVSALEGRLSEAESDIVELELRPVSTADGSLSPQYVEGVVTGAVAEAIEALEGERRIAAAAKREFQRSDLDAYLQRKLDGMYARISALVDRTQPDVQIVPMPVPQPYIPMGTPRPRSEWVQELLDRDHGR